MWKVFVGIFAGLVAAAVSRRRDDDPVAAAFDGVEGLIRTRAKAARDLAANRHPTVH